MNKRDIIQYMIGLSYSTGYEQARKDAETAERHKREVANAFRRGQMAEAARSSDPKRAVDLMGKADE